MRHRAPALLCAILVWVASAVPAGADVILTAENLNAALKQLRRLQRDMAQAEDPGDRIEVLFQLGVEADALSQLLTDEVAAHGSQEKALLDLALERTSQIGVEIAWNREKKRFFYDGAAFHRYLADAPDGPKAAESSFWIVETEFYQSTSSDPERLLAAARRKQEFLERFPDFLLAPDVGVFLGIDYRDLYRIYRERGDEAAAVRHREHAREQFERVASEHPEADAGRIAVQMLRRLEAEAKGKPEGC